MKEGKAPDYRYSLANERTFLAWIRTALAFLATSIGIDLLLHEQKMPVIHYGKWLVDGLALVAVMLGGWAFIRWYQNERAMRLELPLRYTPALLLLSGVIIGTGLFALVLAL